MGCISGRFSKIIFIDSFGTEWHIALLLMALLR